MKKKAFSVGIRKDDGHWLLLVAIEDPEIRKKVGTIEEFGKLLEERLRAILGTNKIHYDFWNMNTVAFGLFREGGVSSELKQILISRAQEAALEVLREIMSKPGVYFREIKPVWTDVYMEEEQEEK